MFFRQPFDRYVLTLWMTEWIDYYDDDDDELEKKQSKTTDSVCNDRFFSIFRVKKKFVTLLWLKKNHHKNFEIIE